MNERAEIESADEALALIRARITQGLTPVQRGTSFYRYDFASSLSGAFITYLDQRGTSGCCRFQNVERVFEFVDLRPRPTMAPMGIGITICTAISKGEPPVSEVP